jgi:hypothetical protein
VKKNRYIYTIFVYHSWETSIISFKSKFLQIISFWQLILITRWRPFCFWQSGRFPVPEGQLWRGFWRENLFGQIWTDIQVSLTKVSLAGKFWSSISYYNFADFILDFDWYSHCRVFILYWYNIDLWNLYRYYFFWVGNCVVSRLFDFGMHQKPKKSMYYL